MKKKSYAILLLFIVSSAVAEEIDPSNLLALPICSSTTSSLIHNLVIKSYQRVREEKRVYSWEIEDRKSRFPHYCIEECACLATEFTKDIQATMKHRVQVFGLRLSGGQGVLPVEIARKGNKSSYQYHEALLIHSIPDNCYLIIDPIMDHSKTHTPKEWLTNIPSLLDNRLFQWKR